MKYLFIFSVILVCSCAFVSKNNNVKDASLCFSDTSFKKTVELNQRWFKSWQWDKDTLKINDFQLIANQSMNINWENFDVESVYFRQFDTLLIALNQYYIDLYSYNTLIEKNKDGIFVAFDVDTKIYVIDKKNKKRCEIASVGSIENIEDAIWLYDNTVILFGYYNENQEEKTPFLWIINIKNQHECIYKYVHSFDYNRNLYFFTKFPDFKLME